MAHDDPVFVGFMAAINRNFELAATMGILGFIPWVRKILPRSWTGQNLVEASLDDINIYFEVAKLYLVPGYASFYHLCFNL